MSPGLFTYGETIIRSFFPCGRLAVGIWRKVQVFFYAYLTEMQSGGLGFKWLRAEWNQQVQRLPRCSTSHRMY